MRAARSLLGVAFAAAVSVGGAVAAGPAQAYGGDGQNNVWQIGLSFNCNNPTVCASMGGTGGFWGWVEFDQPASMTGTGAGNDADAELTGCGHTVGGVGGPGGAGAGHQSIEGTGWFIAPGSAGPHTFFVTGGTMTFTGHGTPQSFPLTVDGNPPLPDGSNIATPQNPVDTGIPADPGHYSTAEVLGMTAPPGVAIQIQVAYKPAH